MYALLVLCILTLAPRAAAQTNLSGTIGEITLERSGNPYLVTDNLTIPAGRTVTIKEGCVLLFNPFSGLVVEGSLVVEGTFEHPVVFSSVTDKRFVPDSPQLPNPFDWNGILITPHAQRVKLSNFELRYSVYGVKSQKEELLIHNGTFAHNGQFHLSVNDRLIPVIDNLPHSLGMNNQETPSRRERPQSSVKPLAPVFGVLSAASFGVGGVFLYRRGYHASAYRATDSQSEMDLLIDRQRSALLGAALGATGGVGALAVAVAVTVAQRRSASVTPGVYLAPQVDRTGAYGVVAHVAFAFGRGRK